MAYRGESSEEFYGIVDDCEPEPIERDPDAAYDNWRDLRDEIKAYPQAEIARERMEDLMDRRQAQFDKGVEL
jgi:hypothetical protein